MLLLNRFCDWNERIVRVAAAMGIIAFPALIFACVFEVVSRYLFHAPTLWAFDMTFMLHGSLFTLCAAFGLQKNVHVRIDVLSALLPKPVQHAANLFAYVFLFIPAMCLIAHAAILRAINAYQTNEVELASAWGPIIWPFFTALAIGVVAMVLQSCVEVIRHATGLFADRARRAPERERTPSDQVLSHADQPSIERA